MAAKDFIVAIELGSSKMTGIAGKKNLDGSISVLAVVKEDSSSFIRNGIVYNINQTVQCISNIVRKLSSSLKSEIARVYVGVGGQSIRSVKNVVVKELPGGAIVSQEMVNELMDKNRSMTYQDSEILDVYSAAGLKGTSSTSSGAIRFTATSTSVSTPPRWLSPRCTSPRWPSPTAC